MKFSNRATRMQCPGIQGHCFAADRHRPAAFIGEIRCSGNTISGTDNLPIEGTDVLVRQAMRPEHTVVCAIFFWQTARFHALLTSVKPMEPAMAEQRSAQIIPFPTRRPSNDPQRLHRALSVLNGALAEQRQAVTQWRGAVGDLQGSVRRLGGSVQLYQARLVALREKVGALQDRAARQTTQFEDDGSPTG